MAIQYAVVAARRQGGTPMLCEAVVDTEHLVPDEDSGLEPTREWQDYISLQYDGIDRRHITPRWIQSLRLIGTCAHEGSIRDGIDFFHLPEDLEALFQKISRVRKPMMEPPQDYRIEHNTDLVSLLNDME